MSFHLKENKVEAIKAITKALQLQPDLKDNPVVTNLVREITGLPTHEVIQTFQFEEQRQVLVKGASGTEQKIASSSGMLTRALLGTALVVLALLVVWFVRSGLLDRYLTAIQTSLLARNKHSINGTEYYLIPPDGEPPVDGWPAVVTLHGYGGKGKGLLPFADIFTSQGVLYISPTFGGYEPYPGNGPI